MARGRGLGDARGASRAARHSLTSEVSRSTLSLCLSVFLLVRDGPLLESAPGLAHLYSATPKGDHHFSISNLLAQMYGIGDSKFGVYVQPPTTFKFRPYATRYRNDACLFNSVPSTAAYCSSRLAFPLLTDQRPSFSWTQNASTSSVRVPDPSLEDCDLIDVLWRRDIDVEKGEGLLSVGPAEQYELDLQLLTEKSIHQALSVEEQRTFEDISRGFFEDFYDSKHMCRGCETANALSSSSKLDHPICWESTESCKPCESVRKGSASDEGVFPLDSFFHLNASFSGADNPILNNVSLSLAAGFNATNVTDSVIAPVYIAQEAAAIGASESRDPLNLTENASLELSTSPIATATLALDDAESTFWFSDAQVRSDVTQSFIDRDAMHESSDSAQANRLEGGSAAASALRFPQSSPSFSGSLTTSRSSASAGSSTELFEDSRDLPRGSPCSAPSSRLYGKLLPALDTASDYLPRRSSSTSAFQNFRDGASGKAPTGGVVRRRGRQSKDELLVEEYGLPATAAQISDMSLSDLQKLIRRETLDDAQRTLIRKIRRRGKNKLAARTCRQRRTENAASLASCGNQLHENDLHEGAASGRTNERRRVILGSENVLKK